MSQQAVIRAIMKLIHTHCLRRVSQKFTGDLTFKLTWNRGTPYPRIKVAEEQTEEIEESA